MSGESLRYKIKYANKSNTIGSVDAQKLKLNRKEGLWDRKSDLFFEMNCSFSGEYVAKLNELDRRVLKLLM